MNQTFTISKQSRLLEFIFFGNYFYGVCAVALSVEAMLQQQIPLNGPLYFFFVFISTVLYYTYPYVRKCSFVSGNPRTNWYTRNYEFVHQTQWGITIILGFASMAFLWKYWNEIISMDIVEWLLVLIFPMVAVFYYGSGLLSRRFTLRKVGWLKPFVIGFIWAGLVTICPVLFYEIIHNREFIITQTNILLFMKNLMYVAVLCIMFDIKDYATDFSHHLKTFVVGVGLRKTIFNILFPLTILGLFSFVYYASTHGFQLMKILLNVLPFVLTIIVAWSLRKRRQVMYYLTVVDGLMLIKALCGIVAISYFN